MARKRRPRKRTVAAVVLLVVGVFLVFGRLGPRGTLTSGLMPLLNAWDNVHHALDPHRPFTRPLERVDERPLAAQFAAMEADFRERFLLPGGELMRINSGPAQVGDVCLWQGVWAGTATLLYVLEKTPARRAAAEQAFAGLALLAAKGRPLARSVYPADLATEPGGRWSFRDDDFQWKEDASIDSAAGWVFGMLLVHEHLPSRRRAALAELKKYADTLIAGGYRLRNSDGARTRFSRVGGAWINSPTGMLTTLAVLRRLERAGAGAVYGREHRRFLRERQHYWAAYASGPLLGRNVTTNHNIAFLALAAALLSEEDPNLRAVYEAGARRLLHLTDKSGNPFWFYLAHWSLGAPANRSIQDLPLWRRGARASLLEWNYPHNKRKRWQVKGEAADIEMVRWPLTFDQVPAEPVPVWRRPAADFVWQRSAYAVADWAGTDGETTETFSPLDFIAAYALGRLSGHIQPGE